MLKTPILLQQENTSESISRRLCIKYVLGVEKSSPYRNCMGVQLHVNQPSPMKILQAFHGFLKDPDPFFTVSTPHFQELSKGSHFVVVDERWEANMSSMKTEKLCNVVMFEKSEKIKLKHY